MGHRRTIQDLTKCRKTSIVSEDDRKLKQKKQSHMHILDTDTFTHVQRLNQNVLNQLGQNDLVGITLINPSCQLLNKGFIKLKSR
jgi:hypothetical protein